MVIRNPVLVKDLVGVTHIRLRGMKGRLEGATEGVRYKDLNEQIWKERKRELGYGGSVV